MDDAPPSLNDPRVQDFLTLARVAHLATADLQGAPHNIPLCFWFDGESRFYFAIDEKPKRAIGVAIKRMRNIAENPQVALVIDEYEEDWSSLASVLVQGEAAVVEHPDEYMLALRSLRSKYPQYRPMTLSPDRNPIVRIDTRRVHVWGNRFGAKPDS
jgi:PPOX class probable F420-dependent enzyme